MNQTQKNKSGNLKSNKPVKKSTFKDKGGTSDKNTSSKGKPGKDVPDSPTTEVNPEG